jgi:hypothetical protein
LPSSKASGLPRIEARYIDNGRGKIDAVQITNHGPGDVFDLDVSGDDAGLMRDRAELPLPRLPSGKSFRVPCWRNESYGSQQSSHFYVTITGKTVDGTPVDVEEFVSES